QFRQPQFPGKAPRRGFAREIDLAQIIEGLHEKSCELSDRSLKGEKNWGETGRSQRFADAPTVQPLAYLRDGRVTQKVVADLQHVTRGALQVDLNGARAHAVADEVNLTRRRELPPQIGNDGVQFHLNVRYHSHHLGPTIDDAASLAAVALYPSN